MINKQKLWFLTLFSLIMILAVYYIALPEAALTKLLDKEDIQSNNIIESINDEDSLATLRIDDDEKTLEQISELQKALIDKDKNIEEKNNAYEKIKTINSIKGKENQLEELILNKFKLKSFIKIKDDNIEVTISSNNNSYKSANDIIRTIQSAFKDKKYITIKYQ